MSDIGSSLAAFAKLSNEERERSIRLIRAFNDAVSETLPATPGASKSPRFFSQDQIDHFVSDYRAHRFADIGPAMERYLSLLNSGYRLPPLG